MNFFKTTCLSVLLAGCMNISFAEATSNTYKDNSCPGKTFNEFFKSFSNDVNIQKIYTHIPLIKYHLVDGDEEPVRKKQTIRKVDFPVIASDVQRKADGLQFVATESKQGSGKIKIYKPDSGYQIYYSFRGNRTCWELIEVDDQSL